MEKTLFMIMMSFIVLLLTNMLHGVLPVRSHDYNTLINMQLKLINKPSIKSFQMMNGDILDCVDINKQLAFDHPLLKNHIIQKKPNFKISKKTTSNDSSTILMNSIFIPKSMRCPIGTVPIKRITKKDLAMQKFSSLKGMTFGTNTSSEGAYSNDGLPVGHQIATLIAFVKNTGVAGLVNLWSPDVAVDQLSDASIYVASDDGPVTNGISAGWAVNPYLYPNLSRLFGYWTKDSGQNTGCFNVLCPGFVQVSKTVYLGAELKPVSVYGGSQYFLDVTIKQDHDKWWLLCGKESVGYWPTALFSSLKEGATRAGWGGEIASSPEKPMPAMGSGHFPEEGFSRASAIKLLSVIGQKEFPSGSNLKLAQSKPYCYKSKYAGDGGEDWGPYMLFGGPPNCNK